MTAKRAFRPSKKARTYGRRVLLVGLVGLFGLFAFFGSGKVEGDEHTRQLSGSDCKDFAMDTWMVPLLLLGTLWLFDGLAVVCDEYFQPALETISEELGLSPDVAGATFLAAGSSAPELFTSFGDTFGPGNSIGMGTIVGSAMFNILVIVALSAFVAARSGSSLLIDWRPVSRDVMYYTSSIIMLTVFFLDGKVEWWESMIMVLGYGSYIVFMVFNEKIMESCAGSPKYQVMPELTDEVNKEEARELEKQFEAAMIKHSKDEKDEQNEEGDVEMAPPKEENRPSSAPEDPEEEEEESVFDMPEGLMDRIMFIITLPFLVLFHFTIPQVDKEAWKNWYWFAFGMSILWIGVLCHYMVDFATRIACTLHISPIVLGLLVLAVGTSVPDAIGSMIAAREGEADMAIANAIGSNVFDILLGLGLPWFLKSIIFGEVNTVDKNGVFDSVIILFITVILFVLVLLINKWKMDKRAGLGLFGLYFVYVLYTIISEATNG